MSFLDEVNSVAMTSDKEEAYLDKIANQKKHLFSTYAESIYCAIKRSIKEAASSGNFSNNIIDGEVEYKICAATSFDGELLKLPLDKLNKYVSYNCQDPAFIAHNNKMFGYEPKLVLRLLDKCIVDGYETYPRRVGIIFKRDKEVRVKGLYCKIFERETKALINEVIRYAKLDDIKINDVFFRVSILAHFSENEHSYAHSIGFKDDIKIDTPRITVDRSKVGYDYEEISIEDYTEDPYTVYYPKQPKIVFKYSFKL